MTVTYTENRPTAFEVTRDCRLVASIPLGGRLDSGAHIYMAESYGGADTGLVPHYWILDRTHNLICIPWRFDHLHEALRRALQDSGWGDYTITPPEGINW